MQLKINPQNPENKKIEKTVEVLKNGGIIVYPTDTIYGLGCDIFNKKAISKIYQIKKREKKKPFSIICSDFKQMGQYAIISNYAYRLIKKCLPGPYTFIFKAKSEMPDTFLPKNKTVGLRLPDNKICWAIVQMLGNPIVSTSLNISGENPFTDPDQLNKELQNKIDIIINADTLSNMPSSIIDLSGNAPVILREGQGDLSLFKT